MSGKPEDGSLAQLVEQLTFNQLVAGSNPARPTIYRQDVVPREPSVLRSRTLRWVVSSVGRAVDF
ncbi:hypothetical protein BN1184_AP_01060 [Pantoea ananatis]|nr:hypothetical protein BN1184_AP_01060 [Pantoea ananatis]